MEPWELQPARDTGLTPAERFSSVRRESVLLESLAHHLSFWLLRMYLASAHRLEVIGKQHVPRDGPFVLAANHSSHLDALSLVVALRPRHRERAFPIAAGDVFFQSPATSVFAAVFFNSFSMWREKYRAPTLARIRPQIYLGKKNFTNFSA